MQEPSRPSPASRRVAIVHVPYRVQGGEETHVSLLGEAYRALGWEPVDFVAALPRGNAADPVFSLTAGHPKVWDTTAERLRPRFFHLHNIHPRLGPAFLRWLESRALPAWMTVHNHRFYCTNGLALRNGEECKLCRDEPSLSRPLLHNCNGAPEKTLYHSLALSQIRGEGLTLRALRRFLAPSPYIRDELEKSGFPRERISLLPHGVDLSAAGPPPAERDCDFIFIGRLSAEKGILPLLEAAQLLPGASLTVVGAGPLEGKVREAAAANAGIRFHGKVPRAEALSLMRRARVACVPSLCQESFSLVAAEALSLGLRLVVADSGSLRHYARPPFGGLSAQVRNPGKLAEALRTSLALPAPSAEETKVMRERFSLETFQSRLRSLLEEDQLC